MSENPKPSRQPTAAKPANLHTFRVQWMLEKGLPAKKMMYVRASVDQLLAVLSEYVKDGAEGFKIDVLAWETIDPDSEISGLKALAQTNPINELDAMLREVNRIVMLGSPASTGPVMINEEGAEIANGIAHGKKRDIH